jgi:hypothetical protein
MSMPGRFTPRRTPVGLIVVTLLFPAFGCVSSLRADRTRYRGVERGGNFAGALGDGTTRDHEAPEPVVGPM